MEARHRRIQRERAPGERLTPMLDAGVDDPDDESMASDDESAGKIPAPQLSRAIEDIEKHPPPGLARP